MPISYLSTVTVPIKVLSSRNTILSRASGFIYKVVGDTIYLVTNWHVVTGRDPSKPSHSKRGSVPVRLDISFVLRAGGSQINLSTPVNVRIDINDDAGNAPIWLEHPEHRFRVDMVVFKLKILQDLQQHILMRGLADCPDFCHEFNPSVMDDVFVVGFPWGLTGGFDALPLFKRGSIASEPELDYGKLPRFLIDCRTSEAMSGAPVICSHSGIWSPSTLSDGQIHPQTTIGTISTFGGVYSGRLLAHAGKNEVEYLTDVSEIGVVWKSSALDEIVMNGIRGASISEVISLSQAPA